MDPIKTSNQFFNPAAYDCEVYGFYEELIEETPGTAFGFRLLGTRPVGGLPDRPVGSDGLRTITITEPIILSKGHKLNVRYAASKDRPLVCRSMIQPLCGPPKKTKIWNEKHSTT